MTRSFLRALNQTCLCIVCMGGVILLESCTDADMFFQRMWYDPSTGQWLINRAMHEHWRWLFYGGMKKGVVLLGICSLIVFFYGMKTGKEAWVRGGLLMVLSLMLTPLAVSTLKAVTDIYCPRQLVEFGGAAAYQRILAMADPANAGLDCGRCFPGGHASGGFALTMIFFCFSGKLRWFGLTVALGYGWIMGLYQMLRGEHFLSHTLMSMIMAWQVNILLVPVVERLLTCVLRKGRVGGSCAALPRQAGKG